MMSILWQDLTITDLQAEQRVEVLNDLEDLKDRETSGEEIDAFMLGLGLDHS